VGSRFSAPVQTGPGATQPPVQWVFPGGKERPGRDADPSLLLMPWSRMGRAIPLLPLRAVRFVQSLFTLTSKSVLKDLRTLQMLPNGIA
jgi:hypothetical protein